MTFKRGEIHSMSCLWGSWVSLVYSDQVYKNTLRGGKDLQERRNHTPHVVLD